MQRDVTTNRLCQYRCLQLARSLLNEQWTHQLSQSAVHTVVLTFEGAEANKPVAIVTTES